MKHHPSNGITTNSNRPNDHRFLNNLWSAGGIGVAWSISSLNETVLLFKKIVKSLIFGKWIQILTAMIITFKHRYKVLQPLTFVKLKILHFYFSYSFSSYPCVELVRLQLRIYVWIFLLEVQLFYFIILDYRDNVKFCTISKLLEFASSTFIKVMIWRQSWHIIRYSFSKSLILENML